jgi:hypothetical protein
MKYLFTQNYLQSQNLPAYRNLYAIDVFFAVINAELFIYFFSFACL